MKTSWALAFVSLIAFGLSAQTATRQSPSVQSKDTPYTVASRDANSRVWERTTYEPGPSGEQIPHLHRYTEIATGMHYKNPQTGKWVESEETIEVQPQGGAAALHGQHQVYFPYDIYDGVIELVTPDGTHLKSRPLGVDYYDGTHSVLIAELKHSIGQILPSGNQVIYTNAFVGLDADLVCTYRRGGFESDLVLRERPPTPESFGLASDTSHLELLTEFFDTAEPQKMEDANPAKSSDLSIKQEFTDPMLRFGTMTMVHGKAFKAQNESAQLRGPNAGISVVKTWAQMGGRKFLIEAVPAAAISQKFQSLPAATAFTPAASSRSPLRKVSSFRSLPAYRLAQANTNIIQLAKADVSAIPGVVIDYNILNPSYTSFTFQGDMTYFVTGTITLFGNTVIEGGTVIKFTQTTGCELLVENSITCRTGPYHPAVLTSVDDDSVGEQISGSTGNPVVDGQNYYLFINSGTTADLHDLRMLYCYCGITKFNSPGIDLRDIQFVHAAWPVWVVTSTPNSSHCSLRNILMTDVTGSAIEDTYIDVDVENLTVNGCTQFGYNDYSAHLSLTNCLLAGVQQMGNIPYSTDHVAIPATNVVVFQTAGAGSCYLATGSPYLNAGTTNINSALLAELAQKTTYPPMVYSNTTISADTTYSVQAPRDTDVPDLGYHYDPLDHCFGGVTANGNLTFSAGTAVGYFETVAGNGYGIALSNDKTNTFNGTEAAPCVFARYSTVQEGNGNWKSKGWLGGISTVGNSSYFAQINATFTHCYALVWDPNHFRDFYAQLNVKANNCEFYGGSLGGYWLGTFFTNCLLDRVVNVGSQERSAGIFWRNCTMHGGNVFAIHSWDPYWPVWIENCAFDGSTINMDDNAAGNTNITYCNYNGFVNGAQRLIVNGAHDLVTNSFAWQSGPLGNWYQPTNSFLIDAGSLTADLVGLYHFTTQTNEVKETNSIVDIGYHYVALDSNGKAVDTDGDTLPDYLEDANGNGVVDTGETSFTNWDTDGDGLSDYEETQILIDASNPSLGHLDPLVADTGGTGVQDGDKDSDNDGISNLAEVRNYQSNPDTAHTFSLSKNDAEFLFTTRASDSSTMAKFGIEALTGDWLTFSITGAFPNAVYDVYYVDNILAQRWQWRRVYSGVQCSSSGSATFVLEQPELNGFFIILDASDDDGDGLSNGYESWFSHSGRLTSVSSPNSDSDTMKDGWETAYGLDPTDATGNNGKTGDPDADGFSNLQEYNNNPLFATPAYDPLKNFHTEIARPVVSISSSDPGAMGPSDTATFTIQRATADTSAALTVYYSVGGDAVYGTDYTLSPSPTEYPRIFSAVIAAGNTTVTVTVTPTALKASGLDSQKLVVKLTPYAVSPTTQVSDPLQWKYVVNVLQDAVTLNLYNVIQNFNGPVDAVKVYETRVMVGMSCGEYHQLIVGGEFTRAGSVAANHIARWNSTTGQWEALGAGVDGPVYSIEAIQRFDGDTSPDIYVGGNFASPAKAIAKWNGASSSWSAMGTGLTSSGFLKTTPCQVNAIRNIGGTNLWVGGRFSSAGGVASENIARWVFAGSQWKTFGGTIIGIPGTAFGVPSQTLMVTAIDPNGTAIGLATNGTTCSTCPATSLEAESYYTVENVATQLRGQGRTAQYDGMRAVSGNIVGHDQINVPIAPVNFESAGLRYSGLSQFGTAGWIFESNGVALPPTGSPYWPIAPYPAGWKAIGPVNALAFFGSDIYIGGSFNTLSGAYAGQHIADYGPIGNIFKWNTGSSTWSTLGNTSTGSCVVPGALGPSGPIRAMDVEYSLCTGKLVGIWVGGNFSRAGGGATGNLALWKDDQTDPINPKFLWDVPATPAIVSPANGTVDPLHTSVTILTSFPATGCTITKVDFYDGNVLLGTATSSPYSFTWSDVPLGVHAIRAIATDGSGRLGVSDPVTLTVQ